MNFTWLVERLGERLGTDLPAAIAHEPMRAKPIGKLFPTFDHKTPPRQGSVLILLYEDNGVIKFPLIKRPTYMGTHSGQVSLPGGKTEEGEDIFQAAVRECEEEIGVNRNDIVVIGQLSIFNVIPSNFLVTPVVGYTAQPPVFIPDPREVEKVIQADLLELLKEDAIKEKEILAAGRYPLLAPHFVVEDEIVWGATAMILNEFVVVMKESIAV